MMNDELDYLNLEGKEGKFFFVALTVISILYFSLLSLAIVNMAIEGAKVLGLFLMFIGYIMVVWITKEVTKIVVNDK